ncbi:metallothionein-like protein type 2 [Mercurialis annua]|uniref:metallothionein-like protein type 2 n=1 Tax=Mercurialis annua TaxID=3986 RepID=UPI0021600DCD|nr:metallothionein-like protein type 2 [Mercurialis annua]
MSCCGGNCGCGSSCGCGNGCKGCGMYPDLGFSEGSAGAEVLIAGLAPVNNFFMRSEMNMSGESGCKCGSSCTCDPCTCK